MLLKTLPETPDAKIHILQVCNRVHSYGFDLFQQITRAYADDQFTVTTIFLRGKPQETTNTAYHGDVKYFQVKRYFGVFWRLLAWAKLFLLCRKQTFDVVICHHYKPIFVVDCLHKLRRFKKLFSVHHNPGNLRRPWRRFMVAKILSRDWQFVTVSDAVKADFLAAANTLKHSRIQTIYNAIDIDFMKTAHLDRAQAREALNLEIDHFVFGNIHRLDPSKGQRYLIEAFAQVVQRYPNSKLMIIGSGQLGSTLQAQVRSLNLDKHVMMPGLIPEATRFIKAFDAFIVPSLNEGFGLALVEAMLGSLPVIYSNSGALPEVCGDVGIAVPPADPKALAEAMCQVYALRAQERESLGAAAFGRVCQQFSLARYHEAFRNLVLQDHSREECL